MIATVLGEEAGHVGHLRELLLRYTQAFLDQITQTAACSRHHLVKQRLATWLLMLCDRTSADQLPMTHEFLARMLGVGRPSVTLTIDALQKARLIYHSRGIVTIVDRQGLEEAACECYQLMREDYDRLLR
jgi:CRP-like cAMP-binding protein